MFTKNQVRDAVVAAIKKTLSTEEVNIRDDELFSDYGIDSLDQMNTILEVESRLKFTLQSEEAENARSVNLLYEILSGRSSQIST